MTKQLININVSNDGRIKARELYDFLGLRLADYSRWVNTNIVNNQFAEENTDWAILRTDAKYSGRPSTNYSLTIQFAKKLCMTSKSERGEQVRNYFIEVEKKFQQPNLVQAYLEMSDEDRAIAYFTAEKEKKQIMAQLEEAKPAVAFVNKFVNADGFKGLSEFAKILGMRPRTFTQSLVDEGILFRKGSRRKDPEKKKGKLLPCATYIDKGYFAVYTGANESDYAYSQTCVTPAGEVWLAELAKKRGWLE